MTLELPLPVEEAVGDTTLLWDQPMAVEGGIDDATIHRLTHTNPFEAFAR